MERADHVLGFGQIDAHLAAHRAIDLGQQRGGHLQEAEPAGVGGGDEAGQVADHPAADGHDDVCRSAPSSRSPATVRRPRRTISLLARRDDDHFDFDVLFAEAFGRRMAWGLWTWSSVMSTTCVVFGPVGQEAPCRGEIALADLNVVGSAWPG